VRPFERPSPPAYRPAAEPIFVQKQAAAPAPVRAATPAPAPEPQPGPAQQVAAQAERKMMKVTNEGMVSVKEEKKQGAVKWR
jgi:hypothetical protein